MSQRYYPKTLIWWDDPNPRNKSLEKLSGPWATPKVLASNLRKVYVFVSLDMKHVGLHLSASQNGETSTSAVFSKRLPFFSLAFTPCLQKETFAPRSARRFDILQRHSEYWQSLATLLRQSMQEARTPPTDVAFWAFAPVIASEPVRFVWRG